MCTDLDENGERLKFTAGWWNFQRRWNLKARKLHGEAGDADDQAIAEALPNLRNLCRQYRPEDVCNGDETGCNYAITPDRSISSSSRSGNKKQKKRITLLVCCNSTGSEKFPLFIIGSARRPRCFQKTIGEHLRFDYSHNKKAWMTMALFFESLERFDAYISKTAGCTVHLLDNSGHGTKDNLPALASVRVEFLPPNTTSKLQSLDAGTICSLKRRYRSAHYNRALDSLEEGTRDIYNISQLTAMRYLNRIWKDLPCSIIANCWRSTGILGTNALTEQAAAVAKEIL